MARCTASCSALWAWRANRSAGGLGFGFYLIFALAITASVQLVGVYLVFASLILPALAVRHLAPRQGVLVGWTLGALAYAAGLAASAWFDWPAGPAMVIALALFSLLSGNGIRLLQSDDSASIRLLNLLSDTPYIQWHFRFSEKARTRHPSPAQQPAQAPGDDAHITETLLTMDMGASGIVVEETSGCAPVAGGRSGHPVCQRSG